MMTRFKAWAKSLCKNSRLIGARHYAFFCRRLLEILLRQVLIVESSAIAWWFSSARINPFKLFLQSGVVTKFGNQMESIFLCHQAELDYVQNDRREQGKSRARKRQGDLTKPPARRLFYAVQLSERKDSCLCFYCLLGDQCREIFSLSPCFGRASSDACGARFGSHFFFRHSDDLFDADGMTNDAALTAIKESEKGKPATGFCNKEAKKRSTPCVDCRLW